MDPRAAANELSVDADPSVRAAQLARLAARYAQAGDTERAFTTLLAADAEVPRLENLEELARLAACSGRCAELFDQLAGHLVDQVLRLPGCDRVEGWTQLGAICFAQLGDREGGLIACDAALALEADHPRALRLRVELLRGADRPVELDHALTAAAAALADLDERVALLVEQSALRRRLGDPVSARAACRRALDHAPADAAAWAALERLVREDGDPAELVDLLDARAVHLSDEDRRSLGREAAAICERSGRARDAIDRLEGLRAEVPADVETLRALDRLYADGHAREQLDVLAALAGAVDDEIERTAIQRRLAASWEALAEPGRAAEALEGVVARCADDHAAYEALARLYLADGRPRAAADAIARHAERVSGPARARLYVELGMLFEEHVEDARRALEYYEKANELKPGQEATLVALARVYELVAAPERAARYLELAARLARTTAAKVGRLTRAAELVLAQRAEAVERFEGERPGWAERLLGEALRLRPAYPPAARALAGVHLARGEQRAAAALLTAALAQAADDDERAELLVELGRVEEPSRRRSAHAFRAPVIDAEVERRRARA